MHLLVLLATLGLAESPEPAEGGEVEDEVPAGPTPLGEDGLPELGLAYQLEARVEPSTGALTGTVGLTWTHPGDTPIAEVPLHLYLNGFSHTETTWSANAKALRDFDLPGKAETYGDPWGHTDLVSVRQGGADCGVRFVQPDDGNPLDRSLAMVTLAEPLQPGETLELELVFDAVLPVPIARTGCHRGRQYCHVGQWYPKLAYYDAEGRFGPPGFVGQQFHGPTEFFAPFADFEVTVDAPAGFDVVGSGREVARTEEGDRQQVRFVQRAVHDVAFVVAPELAIETSTHQPEGGGPEVLLTMVTQPETAHHLEEMRRATELSLDVLSSRVGPYAWSSMTVVEPPLAAAQTMGMEYQTLVTGMMGDPVMDLGPVQGMHMGVVTIAHEVAHNWFQGMIATNEVADAHLDEGMTRYWEHRITAAWAEAHGPLSVWGLAYDPVVGSRAGGERLSERPQAQVARPAWLLAPGTTGAQVYGRMAMLMGTVEQRWGQDEADRLFQAWYARWRFGHPRSEDLLELVRAETEGELQAFLIEGLTREGFPDYQLAKVSSKPWKAPLGRVATADGPVLVTDEDRGTHTDDRVGLEARALESEGRITLELRTPGRMEHGEIVPGRVVHRSLPPTTGEVTGADEEAAFWVSTGRLEGPGWEHLPVLVRFEFDDEVTLDLPWDGRDRWMSFEIVRPAKLVSVRIDPENSLVMEGPVDNNAQLLEPDEEPTRPMAEWYTRVAQWAMASAGMWL